MAFLDPILDFIYELLDSIFGLLPDSPFQKAILEQAEVGAFSQVMNFVNYFIPIGPMLGILTLYLAAVAVWYLYRWLLRFAQYIS